MTKEKFDVAVDESTVRELDELVAVCNTLGAVGFEIVEVMLTAFIRFEPDYAKQVREIIIRKRKGYSLPISKSRALSAQHSKPITRYNNEKFDCSVGTIL